MGGLLPDATFDVRGLVSNQYNKADYFSGASNSITISASGVGDGSFVSIAVYYRVYGAPSVYSFRINISDTVSLSTSSGSLSVYWKKDSILSNITIKILSPNDCPIVFQSLGSVAKVVSIIQSTDKSVEGFTKLE